MNLKKMSNHPHYRLLIGHVAFLVFGVVVLAGIYLYFQSPRPVVLVGVGLVLAHLAVAAGIFFLGRGLLTKLFHKIHGPALSPPNGPPTAHIQSRETQETEDLCGPVLKQQFPSKGKVKQ